MRPIPPTEPRPGWRLGWLVIVVTLPAAVAQGAGPPSPRSAAGTGAPGAIEVPGSAPRQPPSFGFRSLEIFKIHPSARSLQAADVNGDGLTDLVLANNQDGTIHLMLQKRPGEGDDAPAKEPRPNDVLSDSRFRVEKFYTEKQITSLRVVDLDTDGRPDLAYYTDPPELEIVYQDRSWGSRRARYPVRDGLQSPYALNAADLNGDGRTDLVLLGEHKTYVFYQRSLGGLEQPVVLNNTDREPTALEIADVDGDGRLDLLTFSPSQEEPLHVRLQTPSGFGPEIGCRLRPIQAWYLSPFPTGSGRPDATTLFTVQKNPRRVKVYRWRETPSESGLSATHLLALRGEGEPDAQRRHLTDVDGDGRLDVIVSYPAAAQLEVHFQDERGSLSRRSSYPTLSGVNDLTSADLDGDGRPEIIVASRKEKALGVSFWKDGRLRFPETWPDAAPLLVASAPRGDGEPADDVFVVVEGEGSKFSLRTLRYRGGKLRAVGDQPLGLDGTPPSTMRVLDADGDGRMDVLLFVPYADPYLFLQVAASKSDSGGGDPDGDAKEPPVTFREVSRKPAFGLGQLAKLSPSALTISHLEATEGTEGTTAAVLLVSSKSYVRALRLGANDRLQVLEQFSGRGAGSEIVASAMMELDGKPGREVVLVDRASRSLEILARNENGTYEVSQTVRVPSFDVVRLETRDMNGDGREDLVFLGKRNIGVLYSRPLQEGFQEALTFAVEGDEEDELGFPQDLITGDLNGDRMPDLILNTAPRYNLMFLTYEEGASDGEERQESLRPRLTFPIFEVKTYMRRSTNLGPRQMLVEDVDGDGLKDLALLVHDRILLYLQDKP
ncbi:MAG: VCBS repeat-containing protein [Planctomycetota bacterium]|nr:VCBS repeat-containing protein [Planctomycetota bacterium]